MWRWRWKRVKKKKGRHAIDLKVELKREVEGWKGGRVECQRRLAQLQEGQGRSALVSPLRQLLSTALRTPPSPQHPPLSAYSSPTPLNPLHSSSPDSHSTPLHCLSAHSSPLPSSLYVFITFTSSLSILSHSSSTHFIPPHSTLPYAHSTSPLPLFSSFSFHCTLNPFLL